MSPTTLLRLRPTALVSIVVALTALASAAKAQPRTVTDLTAGVAVNDGIIGATEYAGSTSGINVGFGGVLGAGTRMHIDSDTAGNLALGLEDTTSGGAETCNLGADDSIVIYIDSRAGGVADTTALLDTLDGGRAAISGRGTGGGVADLTFAPGFTADFAIVLRDDSASLFRINVGGSGSHTFIRSLTRSPGALFGAACIREVSGFSLADLGTLPGVAIDYVATLINASNGFRSNEWQGAATGSASGNIGAMAFALSAGDFDTFQTYAAPAVIAGQKTVVDFTGFAGTGFQPTPAPGRLDSRNWAATGWSNGDLAFGGTQTTASTDYTRGTTAVAISAGGFYNFAIGTGGTTLGIQPGGADFAPGTVTLRLQNTASTRLTRVDLSYTVYVRNDQGRGTTFDPSWSTDDTTYTPLPSANLTTTVALDALGFVANQRSVSISGLSVPAGGFFYVRWSSVDAGGSGSRDELALDDIVFRSTFDTCGDGALDLGEACDSGASNGSTPCGCSATCTFPASGTACGAAGPSECDAADTCDGAGSCVDRVLPAGTSCRPSAGGCDLAESCDGALPVCPADGHVAAGVICRASIGPCDATELCPGDDDFCPADGAVANGTPCADGIACNGSETCAAGACTAGAAITCNDGNVCTADACAEPAGTCTNSAIAGCCTLAAQCNDGSACTADSCDLGTNRCVNTPLVVAELCGNGIDDDCDGSTDEGFPTVGTACTAGVGACVDTGSVVCSTDRLSVVCNAVAGAPSAELCNGIDDDCDGTVDDAPATVLCANQTGICSGARTTSCGGVSGWLACANADYEAHDARFDVADTSCDGLDNDCGGGVDEDFVSAPTTCGVGACARTGTSSCVTGAIVDTCTAGSVSPELCNGIDDDCDGSVDDAPATVLCANQTGICAGARASSCGGVAGWLPCVNANYEARDPRFDTVDTVCDGLDNDCDGSADEEFAAAPTTCGVGACARTGSTSCTAGAVIDSCAAGTPAASDTTCDGVDDDCDGSRDENFVAAPTTCGLGVCARTGVTSCTAGVSADSCVVGAAGTETCNGLDDDCNGTVDDGGSLLCAGSATGTACTTNGSATFCGCVTDAACGGPTSARICDASTSRCTDGCYGTTRNGCPTGLFCTSMDATTPGVCTTSCTMDAECAAFSAARPFCVISGATGTCAECRDDSACAARIDGRVACIGASNTCAECTAADRTRCDATTIGDACLSSGLCGCAGDADCATDRECDLSASQCVPRPMVDGGMPDAGMDTDAGVDTDAGIDTDAGMIDSDAGIDTDASVDTDAGTDLDSGIGVDLGRADLGSADLGSDAGAPPSGAVTGGACGCRAASEPSSGGSGALVSLGALAMLLVTARRRRR